MLFSYHQYNFAVTKTTEKVSSTALMFRLLVSKTSNKIGVLPLFAPASRFGIVSTLRPFSCASSSVQPAPITSASDVSERKLKFDSALPLSAFMPPAGTLTDTFGRAHTYLRISLTERCNLRCTYCMPEGGVDLTPTEQLLTADEILRLTRLFVAAGVTKVRFTGGEPLVRRDLVDLVRGVKAMENIKDICVTTNGILLSRRVEALAEAGLSAVNISLDTLDPFKFELITRRKGHDVVLQSIDAALAANVKSVKVNCVVMRGVNDYEVNSFVEMTKDRNIEVRFIEYMPFDGNKWDHNKMVPYDEMVKVLYVWWFVWRLRGVEANVYVANSEVVSLTYVPLHAFSYLLHVLLFLAGHRRLPCLRPYSG